MKKYVFESLKFFCAAILCTILSAFASPSWGANCNLLNPDTITSTTVTIPVEYGKTYVWSYDKTNYDFRWDSRAVYGVDSNNEPVDGGVALSPGGNAYTTTSYFVIQIINPSVVAVQTIFRAASIQPTIESIKNSKMMFEEGTTATAYTPYNPLCATCNGTIVNYVSATGTGVQNGTPTPTNPIEPTFYKQGNMVLRKVGDYADTYDATTGKITRRVGVKVLDGTEDWVYLSSSKKVFTVLVSDALLWKSQSGCLSNAFACTNGIPSNFDLTALYLHNSVSRVYMTFPEYDNNVDGFKQYLAQQYAAGTPVTVYYPLAEETTEDWPASYCETPIKIATTKYNESAFGPLNTALANAISVVDTVVSNTITQVASIATLQTQKQTRPNDIADDSEKCPAGQKCLLVEDATGVPHWYAIQESYLPLGYTPLKYIEFNDTQTLSIPFSGINSGDWEFYAKWITLAAPTANYSCIFNVYKSEDHVTYRVIHVLKNVNEYFLTGNSRAGSGGFRTVLEANEIHTASVKTDHTVIADGNISRTASPATNLPDTVNLTLCSGFKRYYEMRVTKNNVIQINLIPAKRNSDGTVGFYDTASNTFKTATTGSFIAGPVVE